MRCIRGAFPFASCRSFVLLEVRQLDAGRDNAEEEPPGEHIAGIEPGVFGQSDDQNTAEAADRRRQQPPEAHVRRGAEGFYPAFELPEEQRQEGEQASIPVSPHICR